jgi:2-polyprenyl-3-methyl-5-hydroxy-6-metoxy-1,4-benzoquinol methylase
MGINCRVCGGGEAIKYGSVLCRTDTLSSNHYRKRELFKCNYCKSISVDPIPSQKELSLYYDYYSKLHKHRQFSINRKSLQIIKQVTNLLKNGKILDLGCGFGDILAALPSSFKKFGIDLSLTACREAKKKGIEVFCSNWDVADFNSQFELIIALDFLEHVNDASKALHKIGQLLTKGGYVVIETGNAASWSEKSLGEDWYYPSVYGHLQVLSLDALVNIAKNAQIETISLIKGRQYLVPVGRILYRIMVSYGFHFLKLTSLALRPVTDDLYFMRQLLYRDPPVAFLKDHVILVGRKI